jgi:hypothetical protein
LYRWQALEKRQHQGKTGYCKKPRKRVTFLTSLLTNVARLGINAIKLLLLAMKEVKGY